jgi:hypothetical protein
MGRCTSFTQLVTITTHHFSTTTLSISRFSAETLQAVGDAGVKQYFYDPAGFYLNILLITHPIGMLMI